ncbi:DNA-processing protein DprA [Klugiella xanthotipulae]|uniref:DNA protecting protein DprA n=1 Tax=Klugiella xanthotipulae TaxID=244735 RepID=A0A543HRW0_9MICO|nr:DNA-processing protein DprA [Klugiella xanthotipulae]TQM61081.1 DNA protecting protein DprA [Klugiella xanthotipulae]
MTYFGLSGNDVRGGARKLLGGAETAEALQVADEVLVLVFARSVWSRLAEPGDRIAGVVINELGAVRVLDELVAGTSSSGLLSLMGDGAREELAASGRDGRRQPATADYLGAACERWRPRLISAEALRACDTAALLAASILVPELDGWPARVNDLGDHSPIALWSRGRVPSALLGASLSMVGSRASTGYGEHATVELASGVAARGLAVVSGGAYGIDGTAHRSALFSHGSTVAVLAGGIDRLYPSGHVSLFDRILADGLIVSEMPPGFSPTRWRFLQRNRIIAALGNATLVCEAGSRSGSLNTAGHAASMGRPLGAVPGPITSASSAGCHKLLREYDAVCVTTVDEAVELAGIAPASGVVPMHDAISGHLLRVTDALRPRKSQTLAEIAAATGLSPGDTRTAVAELELMGRARCDEEGWRSIASRAR